MSERPRWGGWGGGWDLIYEGNTPVRMEWYPPLPGPPAPRERIPGHWPDCDRTTLTFGCPGCIHFANSVRVSAGLQPGDTPTTRVCALD